MKKIIISGIAFPLLALMILPGCGEKQAIGTGGGALIGNAVSGKKSKGIGTLLGALAGNIIGKAIDKDEKKAKDRKQRITANRQARHRAEVRDLEDENRHLKKHAMRECPHHGKVRILGATRCPECGTKTRRVCTKKYCTECGKTYPKKARYCAFCPNKVRLNAA